MTQQQEWAEFIEAGADLEHDRWAKWQKYLHSLCTVELKDGTFEETGRLIIEADRVKHWNRQIETAYSQLSEKEKESDRIEVRKYIPLIAQEIEKTAERISKIEQIRCDEMVAQEIQKAKEEEKRRIVKMAEEMKKRTDLKDTMDRVLPNAKLHGYNQALTDLTNNLTEK